MLNGYTVTESQSDDPDAVENAVTPLHLALKGIIRKRMAAVSNRCNDSRQNILKNSVFFVTTKVRS